MKAVRIHEHGGPEVLQYEDAPDPEIGAGEALIRVKACALNHLDLFVRAGAVPGLDLPHTSGSDVAGTLEDVGADVDGFQPGDHVVLNPSLSCGNCEFCRMGEDSLCASFSIVGEHGDGGYAELVKVPARNLSRMPDGFSFEQAAAAPLTFLTAWRMLMTRARLRTGEDVLILGASGGVGTAALQIAKLAGARVFVTAGSDEKLQRLQELGADELINYNEVDFSKDVYHRTGKRGVDVVVESVGEATFPGSVRCLRKGGRLVCCGATTGPQGEMDLRVLFWKQLELIGSTMGTRAEFDDVMNLVWDRKLEPIVHRTFPLSDAQAAHEAMAAGDVFGKLVLIP
ncbi:MAG: zinc-binding dehydrogenase [Candidatus Bipolaricaulia bacterium]